MRPALNAIHCTALASAIFFVSCGSSSGGSTSPPSAGDCPTGLVSATDGNGCIDSLPTTDCASGTRAAYGQSTCAVMPLSACPTGFSADVSGWGCRAIVPPSPCAAGTIEELGSTTCAPLGDCSAAFPPANATLFVSATGPTDATHFTTVGAAIAAATSGAVIAVSPGTYVEGVAVARPVSIVGKCAAQVIVKSSGDGTGGLVDNGALGVSVSGITFQGHAGGVGEVDGDLTLTDVEIDGARGVGVSSNGGALHVNHSRISGVVVANGFGFGASGGSGMLEIDRSVITGSAFIGVLGSVPGTISITQSIIENTSPGSDGQNGGVLAVNGSHITVDGSAVLQNGNNGIVCANAGSTMHVTGSTIDGVLSDASKNAEGVAVDDGGAAVIESSSIFGAAFSAVMENDKSSTLDLSAVAIVGSGNSPEQGIIASLGSTITLENTAIVGTRNYGLFVQDAATTATVTGSLFRDVVRIPADSASSGTGLLVGFGGAMTMTDSTIAKASTLGALIGGAGPTGSGSTASFTNMVIVGTRADETGAYGRGAQVSDGASATFEASVIADNDESSLLVIGDGSSATIQDSVLRSSGVSDQSPLGYGFAVLANASASLSHSWVRDNAAIGLVFDTSSANVDNSVIANNPIGVYASGTSLEDVTDVPATPTSGQVAISQSTRFANNQTRVSSDQIPLPQVVTPSP